MIVSANYFDRKSEQRWLIRQEDQRPVDAVAYKAIKATGVVFEESGEEEGFGCTIVARCESAEGFDADPTFNVKKFQELTFDGFSFCSRVTKKIVTAVDAMYLTAEGKIFAKMPPRPNLIQRLILKIQKSLS